MRDTPRPRPGEKEFPLSVEALVRVSSMLIEERIGVVWVEAEVTNLRMPGSGHIYFNLKDAHGGASLPAVMWRSTAQKLRTKLAEGKKFLVRGKPGIFAEQGKFQMYVEFAEPAGLGAAALALEELKRKLAAEGLFAEERKRRLPRLPKRIAIVTSPTGAAVKDIVKTIERRFPTPVLIVPTKVQGDLAAAEIAAAIRRAGRVKGIEVVIVGRGGGSSEDLSAFNEEPVVRAIATCPVPVISAVGHEIDVTLADLAADVRAATPTAAAELAVPERALLVRELEKLERRLGPATRRALGDLGVKLDRLKSRLGDPTRQLHRDRQRMDEAMLRMAASVRKRIDGRRRLTAELERRLAIADPRARLEADRARLKELAGRLASAMRADTTRRRRAFENAAGRLDAMSPLKVLDRGYAIARTPEGEVITRADQAKAGDPLEVRVAKGTLDVRVEHVKRDE
jgi:exodeoxyribonuclease VII large subunit